MHRQTRIATTLIALILIGCKSAQPNSAAAVTGADGSGAVPGASISSATRVDYITDPTLNNMNAAAVTIPSNWHFQGVLYQGGNCVSVPSPVFRATSPDGLSLVEIMPPLGWFWGTGPFVTYMPKSDCLPMKGPMSAQDFLKYLAATMKLDYVGDETVPAEINAKVQKALADAQAAYAPSYAAMHSQPPKTTRELARATVRSQNGSYVMSGRLAVMLECTESYYPGMKSILQGMPDRPASTVDKCNATASYYEAPQAQYAGMIKVWDTPGMGAKSVPEWGQAWIQRNNQQSQQRIAQMAQQSNALMQQRAQQFQHDQAVRQEMHEQFMATMQRGTDMSMARAQSNMNARSTATSDWVDYALDQKTVLDPTTGQVSKVSNSYTHTWVDSSGKLSYQTNDVNANPNGVLPGTWTQQQTVHGDGTPR